MSDDGQQTFLDLFTPAAITVRSGLTTRCPNHGSPAGPEERCRQTQDRQSSPAQAERKSAAEQATQSPREHGPGGSSSEDLQRCEQGPGGLAPEGRRAPEIVFERSLRARHYRLTLRRDGTAVATIPARGSQREALRFVTQHRDWLERARERQQKRPRVAAVWTVGTHVLWRGELREIRPGSAGERPQVCLAADLFRVPKLEGDLRPTLEAHFARRAKIELPARAWELAAVTGVEVKHVTVRNQRSRWGSCSANGTISLNWRLVQTPDFVRDYIIFHELMHLREMNHSARFWARVEGVCPGWRDAERWIKRNGALVGL